MSCMPVAPQQNYLLAALPENINTRLSLHLELVRLQPGQILYEAGDSRRYMYFPVNAIVSLMHVLENGSSVEISMIGSEGVVGIASFMGGERTPWRAVVQTGGQAYRLLGTHMRNECSKHAELMQLMLRYTQTRITQMSQTAVCNRHHSIDQQFCRWLLLSLDRLQSNQLNMTQELIANTLGVRREGITVAAGKLHKMGVIAYSRGAITVLNRAKLEQLSCECYAVVRKETNRLLPVIHRNEQSMQCLANKFLPINQRSFTTLTKNELVAA